MEHTVDADRTDFRGSKSAKIRFIGLICVLSLDSQND